MNSYPDFVDLDALAPEPAKKHASCIVGKLLSEKSASPFAIIDVMKKAWKGEKGLDAIEWSNNLFLFRFDDVVDTRWVLDNQPWHFDGNLFLIRALNELEQPSKIQICGAQLWIRFYDAPLLCMNTSVARSLGNKIGKLICVDPSLDHLGKYIRVKVELDVNKPLKCGINVRVGGDTLWLPIKYESLPLHCYNCGLLGHTFKFCEEALPREEFDPLDLPFCSNIVASPLKKSRPRLPTALTPNPPIPPSSKELSRRRSEKRKLDSMEKELRDKEEELERLESLNSSLIIMERMASEELQEARKQLIIVFKDSRANICVKRMGELDGKPFMDHAKVKYGSEQCEKAMELCSLWEDHLRDPSWHPYKVITVGDKIEEVLDEHDEKLKEVKNEFGEEVYEAVTRALNEMNVYNPSGRYPVLELWNNRKNRRALLKEGIAHLLNQWTQKW